MFRSNFVRKFKRVISLTVVVSMLVSIFPSVLVSAEIGSTNFTYEDYSVEYNIQNEWSEHQNIQVTITNTGTEPILNWAFKYNASGEITGLYNGIILDNSDTEYIIKNAGYNYEILPNSSVTFGYTLKGDNLKIPQNFELVSKRFEIDSGFDVRLDISNEWDTGFNGFIMLENTSEAPLEAWILSLQTNFIITDLWGATLEVDNEGNYKISSQISSNPIPVGGLVEIGITADFVLNSDDTDDNTTNDDIIADDSDDDDNDDDDTTDDDNLDDKADDDNIDDKTDDIIANNDNYSPILENYSLSVVIIDINFDEEEIDYDLDSDGDGLPDYLEKLIGTDPFNPDTDGDGLPDGYEYFILGTDPTEYDTLGEGKSDGEYDFDEDGLTNLQEYEYETDPFNPDTDGDGLSDYDEIFKHNTDPLNFDTDNDGVWDGDELILGLDPNNPITDGRTPDGERKFSQNFIHEVKNEDCAITEVRVDMDATNYIYRTTQIQSIMEIDVMSSNVVGLVGDPFDITTTSKFDKATINFKVDPQKLGDTNFENLMFLWYDYENDNFVELETDYDYANMTVSTTVEHFSRYMIVDRTKWLEIWNNQPYHMTQYGMERVCDTILVIDVSGSMSSVDTAGINSNRGKAANAYIDSMRTNDRAAIVLFDSVVRNPTTAKLTKDKNYLISELSDIGAYGGTNFSVALNKALELLENSGDRQKNIIFLSDGIDGGSVDNLNNSLSKAIDMNVIIHTIGLGSASGDTTLKNMSTKTGGEFFKTLTSSQLIEIYKYMGITDDFDKTDTDKDGIPDAIEISGLVLSNGSIIYTNPFDSDTDGDGLLDGKEAILTSGLFYDGTFPRTKYYYKLNSDPTKADSDGDGIVDDIRFFDSDKYKLLSSNQKTEYKMTEFSDPNPLDFDHLWEWPVYLPDGVTKVPNVSSAFNETLGRDPIHAAIDINTGQYDAVRNRLVKASYSGVVTRSGVYSSYGNSVDIVSEINDRIYLHRYSHLASIDPKITHGASVNTDTIIGIVGNTGGDYGVHLDFLIVEIKNMSLDDIIKQGNITRDIKFLSPGRIDPILFDRYVDVSNSIPRTYNIKKHNYNMLMNIPKNIKSTCTSCPVICGGYIDEIKLKYGLINS